MAKEAKNPFADLINLQLFYDVYPGVAPAKNTEQVLTLQPLIPFQLNSDWIVITRTILPFVEQPGASAGEDWVRGVGDTQFAAFLSPARVGSLDWGVGAVFQLPTASNNALGPGEVGCGASSRSSVDRYPMDASAPCCSTSGRLPGTPSRPPGKRNAAAADGQLHLQG